LLIADCWSLAADADAGDNNNQTTPTMIVDSMILS
jgi:hypothetical protein